MNGSWLRLLAAVLMACSSLQGGVIRVPEDYASIKGAVYAAAEGDVIEVDDGYYFERNVVLDKAITLRAKTTFRAVIYGDEQVGYEGSVFIIKAPVAIEGLILIHGQRGILQRGSPDVAWTAENLAILNMTQEAISINAAEGNIGRGIVHRVIIDNCGAGIVTNDAHSLDVSHCLVANCGQAFAGYDHIQFKVARTMIWHCGRAFTEEESQLPAPRCSAIDRGEGIEIVDHGIASGLSTTSFVKHFFTDSGTLPRGFPAGTVGLGLVQAIAGDVCARLGESSFSIPFYQAALKSGEEATSEEVIWRAHTGLALAQEELGDYTASLENFRAAVLLLERLREKFPLRISNPGFLHDKVHIYVSFIHLLFKMHRKEPRAAYLEEAFACAERSKARSFLDSLEETGLGLAGGVSPGIASERKRLSEEISRCQIKLQKPDIPPAKRTGLLAELEKLENSNLDLMIRMRRDIPSNIGRRYAGPAGPEEVRASVLSPGTGLVEFMLGEEHSFAFWVTRDTLSLAQLPAAGDLIPLVKRYRSFLTLRNPERFLAVQGGGRLFDILLGPFRAEMTDEIKRIIIIPDGHLYNLPFESLMIGDRYGGKERRFLVEDFEISYAPSASALVRLAKRYRFTASGKDLLSVSVPDLPISSNYIFGYPINLPKLRHADEEIKAISQYFAEERQVILRGPQAEEGQLKRHLSGEFRYIHLAVHGIFDDKHWDRSGLLLWREEGSVEDGILQLRDVNLQELQSDLVVLSACQSGLGRIDSGEGLVGLTAGFLLAGSRAVLVSLWNIADRSTAKFMGRFYGHLREGKSPSRALQETKLEMLHSPDGHPSHWAAFVLMGDAPSYSISK